MGLALLSEIACETSIGHRHRQRLFDSSGDLHQDRWRDGEAERGRSLLVHNEFKARHLLGGKTGRICTLEDSIDLLGDALVEFGDGWPVGDEAAIMSRGRTVPAKRKVDDPDRTR